MFIVQRDVLDYDKLLDNDYHYAIFMLDPKSFCGTLIENRYHLQKFLGNGAFGFVFAADEMALGESVGRAAVKLIRPQSDAHRAEILHEIRAMANLTHPHLLGYRSSGEFVLQSGEKLIFLALELANGSLEESLENQLLTTPLVHQMAIAVASALAYLQGRGVVHRDLKPANILRVGDAWKIADFGLARLNAQTFHQTAAAGTLSYMSPDAIDGEVSAAGDLWAFGVLLQECLTGKFPYPHTSQLSFIRNVASQEPFIAPAMPPPFDQIVRGCLDKNPKTRWTAHRVLDCLAQSPRAAQNAAPSAPTSASPTSAAPAPIPPAPVMQAPPAPRVVAAQPTAFLPRQAHEPVVDASGGATYRTIGEALAATPHAARIWVRAGVYCEGLLLDRAVEIIGEGEREEIVIQYALGNCVKVVGGAPVLRNVLVCGVAKTMNKQFHAISVNSGDLLLENCIVVSDSLACVAVQGATSSTRLSSCALVGGATDGVLVSNNAKIVMESCRVAHHARHGVHLKSDATAVLRDCEINENGACGVLLDNAKSGLQNCRVVSNRKSGVRVSSGGALMLRRCTVTDNRQQAIEIERGARAKVESCDLRRNVFGAWSVASGGMAEKKNNQEG